MAQEAPTIQYWLEGVLGQGVEGPWNAQRLSAQLNSSRLREITIWFEVLPTQIKLKTLMSMLYMSERFLNEYQRELEELLSQALKDTEYLVAFLAEVMQPYPSTRTLNHEIKAAENEENKNVAVYNDIVEDFEEELKAAKELNILPLECYFVNEKVLKTILAENYDKVMQKATTQHFQIRRKSKAEQLREKLVQDPFSVYKKPSSPPPVDKGNVKSKRAHSPEVSEIGVRVKVRPTKVRIPRRTPIEGPKEPR